MLRASCGPVFQAEAGSDAVAEAWLAKHGRDWATTLEGLGPKWQDIGVVARGARSIAPGPDGLRYTAWVGAGEVAWRALGRLLWAILEGTPVARKFAATLMAFLPKRRGRGQRSRTPCGQGWGCRTPT